MATKNGFKGIGKSWDVMARKAVEGVQDVAIVNFAEKVTMPAPSQGASGFTPVLEGVLIANTKVAYGHPNKSFSWNAKDPSGRQTFNKLVKETNADIYLPIFITNNTPYNINAEFTGWQFTEPYRYFRAAVASSIEALNRYT